VERELFGWKSKRKIEELQRASEAYRAVHEHLEDGNFVDKGSNSFKTGANWLLPSIDVLRGWMWSIQLLHEFLPNVMLLGCVVIRTLPADPRPHRATTTSMMEQVRR
jgi:hypothetical protein